MSATEERMDRGGDHRPHPADVADAALIGDRRRAAQYAAVADITGHLVATRSPAEAARVAADSARMVLGATEAFFAIGAETLPECTLEATATGPAGRVALGLSGAIGEAFTAEDESLLQRFAQAAYNAIEQRRAIEHERAARRSAEDAMARLALDLEQRERYESLLAAQKEIFEQIAAGAPLAITLETLVRELERLSGSDVTASILLLEDGRLRHGAAPGLPEFYTDEIDGVAIGPDVGSCGAAAWRRTPVVVTDVSTDPKWAPFKDVAARAGIAACWSTPLIAADGTVLGTFAMYASRPRGPNPGELSVIDLFARAATVAIQRHRDIGDLMRERRVVSTLHDVGRAISAQLDVDEIIRQVTDAATGLTGAQFGAFFYNMVDEHGESYMLYALSGASREAFERFPMPRNTAIFDPTFRGEAPVRLDDVTQDERFGRSAPHFGMPQGHLPVRSYLAVPVVAASGEVIGGLFFGHEDAGVFTAEDETVAHGIASHAAIAIQNARLYESKQRESEVARQAYEERDRVASVLQTSLLPPAMPEIPGAVVAARYRAGSERVGGDFYDVFPLRGRDWGIAIGDVCGKGPDAAALTALSRHSIRAAAMLQRQPSRVLHILNQAILRGAADGRFATAIFARMTPSSRGARMVIARGGHPPVAVLRSWGDVMFVDSPGTLLGVFDEAPTSDELIELARGDVAVFYTDGVIEARRDGELFGRERLSAILSTCRGLTAEDIAERIEREASEFNDGDSADDIAIVVVAIDPKNGRTR